MRGLRGRLESKEAARVAVIERQKEFMFTGLGQASQPGKKVQGERWVEKTQGEIMYRAFGC